MDFVREIIEADKLTGIINIPEKLRHSPVEIIVLPVMNIDSTAAGGHRKKQPKKEKYKELYENPIKVKKIMSFSREELHER
jgi:hypothetical protein